MALPRPSSPRALWADFRAFSANRGRHHWAAAGLAILIPAALILLFYVDGKTNMTLKPQVIYAQSWSSDRTDEQIKADQVVHQKQREAKQKERQRQYQKVENQLKKIGL